VEEAKKLRLRRTQAQKQYEMQDPFLHGRLVWTKLEKEANNQSCKIPAQGQPSAQPNSRDRHTVGPQDGTRIAAVTETLAIQSDSMVLDAITLISLAAKERLRALVEDAATIARGRRTTSHGVVALEFKDIATGLGKATETTPSRENPLKRMCFAESQWT
jgi:hypothetical protein